MSSKPKEPETEEGEEKPKKTSMVVHIVSFLLVTAIAAGAGFGASILLAPADKTMEAENSDADQGKKEMAGEDGEEGADADQQAADEGMEKEGDSEEETMAHAYARPIAPIVTNLRSPKNVWVRMELALVTEKGAEDELLEKIHQDLVAYIRTVKLHHVEGPSGFINLKSELNEIASIRSGGLIKKVLIRTMLFE